MCAIIACAWRRSGQRARWRGALTEAFRSLGLTSGQFSIMMSLNRPEPPSVGALAALLATDRSTLTANLKPLERRGPVAVAVDPTDRRGRRPALTDAGQRLLRDAVPIWTRTHENVDRLLARSKAAAVRSGLGGLASSD